MSVAESSRVCATLTAGSRVNKSNGLVVRPVRIRGWNDEAVRVQCLPHGEKAIHISVMQPEDRVESRHFWKLHVAITPNAVVNAVVDGFDVIWYASLTTRPGAGEVCVVVHGREKLVCQ